MNSYDDDNEDPFIQLGKFDPGEWPNIPRPLLLLMICMQECISISHKNTKGMVDKCLKAADENKRKIQEIDMQFPNLKNLIVSAETTLSSRINEVNSKLSEEISSFKSNLYKDLDFKHKSTDTKLNSLQDQVFALKKIVNTLPFIQEIENSIKDSCNNLRISLKKEVIDYIIKPEIASLNAKISLVNENNETYICKLQEVQEVHTAKIQVLTDQFNEKFVSFERILAQSEKDFKESCCFNEVLIQKVGKEIKIVEKLMDDKAANSSKFISLLEGKVKVNEQQIKNFIFDIQGLKGKVENLNQENLKVLDALRSVEEEQVKVEERLNKFKDNEAEKGHEGGFKDNEGEKGHEGGVKDDEVGVKLEAKDGGELIIMKKDSEEVKRFELDFEVLEDKKDEWDEKKIKSEENEKSESEENELVIGEKSVDRSNAKEQITSFEFSNKLEEINEITLQVKGIEDKILETREILFNYQASQKKEKQESDFLLKEIHEKLQWFPMNLQQLKNKSPSEARLYTLEARLRMEENTRFEQFNHLISAISHLKLEFSSQDQANAYFPNIAPGRQTAQVSVRRSSRDNITAFQKKSQEPDQKPKTDPKFDNIKLNSRRLSSDTDRTPRGGYFHRIPVSTFLSN